MSHQHSQDGPVHSHPEVVSSLAPLVLGPIFETSGYARTPILQVHGYFLPESFPEEPDLSYLYRPPIS
jgi:hypothetical protein